MNDTNFFSIDRLVEFGMTMAIAQQMVSSMNESITKMNVPGNIMPKKSNAYIDKYYAVINGAQSGPYSQSELTRLIKEKKVVSETYVWKPGMRHWDLAQNIDEIIKLVAIIPPPLPDNI